MEARRRVLKLGIYCMLYMIAKRSYTENFRILNKDICGFK